MRVESVPFTRHQEWQTLGYLGEIECSVTVGVYVNQAPPFLYTESASTIIERSLPAGSDHMGPLPPSNRAVDQRRRELKHRDYEDCSVGPRTMLVNSRGRKGVGW